MKYFVICGNQQQYSDFIKRKAIELFNQGDTNISLSDFVYVSGPEKLKGYSDPHGWLIGTWRELPDIKIILSVLVSQYRNELVPQSIMDAWEEVNTTNVTIWSRT